MRALLACLAVSAAAIVFSGAAAAEESDRLEFVAKPSFGIVSGRHDGRHDGRFRRHRGDDGTVFVYDRDYQGDTAWRPESFNDWWHERPNRSHPAWLRRNQDCQRMWWDGNVLRC